LFSLANITACRHTLSLLCESLTTLRGSEGIVITTFFLLTQSVLLRYQIFLTWTIIIYGRNHICEKKKHSLFYGGTKFESSAKWSKIMIMRAHALTHSVWLRLSFDSLFDIDLYLEVIWKYLFLFVEKSKMVNFTKVWIFWKFKKKWKHFFSPKIGGKLGSKKYFLPKINICAKNWLKT